MEQGALRGTPRTFRTTGIHRAPKRARGAHGASSGSPRRAVGGDVARCPERIIRLTRAEEVFPLRNGLLVLVRERELAPPLIYKCFISFFRRHRRPIIFSHFSNQDLCNRLFSKKLFAKITGIPAKCRKCFYAEVSRDFFKNI